MVKLFPKKTIIIQQGGGQGLGMNLGTETESMTFTAATSEPTGTETESMAFTEVISLVEGTQTESMVVNSTGSAVYPQGSETDSFGFSVAQTMNLGTETDSMTSSAVADLIQTTTTAADLGGAAPVWATPTQAQGAFNSDDAATPSNTASHPGVTGLQTTMNATLRCSGLIVTSTPSGFTRNSVGIRIRHKYDISITLPIAGVKDVTYDIDLRDSANVLIANLKRVLASGGAPTVNPLQIENFDITSLVSEAQLTAGVKVDVHIFSTGTLVAATDGTACYVDGVYLVANYSRTGIT